MIRFTRQQRVDARKESIARLRRLLKDVPGTSTSWTDIAEQLDRLSMKAIDAISYRVEAAMKQSYDDGYARGKAE